MRMAAMRCAFASGSGRGVLAAFLSIHGLLAGVASVAGEPPKAERQPRAPLPRYGRALGGLSTEPETPVDKLPASYHGALGQILLMHKQWSQAQEAFKEAYRKKSAERAEARRQPTERQLAFARDLGLDPPGDTRQQLSSLISVGIYVRDVLKELSVTPPPPAEYTSLVRQIARSQALRAKVKEVEQQRYDRAFDEQERI